MGGLRRFGSLRVSVLLLALTFLTVLGGTLGQVVWGAAAVQTTLFSRVVFEAGGLWFPGLPFFLALLGGNLALGAWFHLERSVRHLGLWGIHLSLVLFCFGSLGMSLAQQDLVLGLAPGAGADRAFVKDSPQGETRPLPFVLTVTDFRIETYPLGTEPSDYVSQVTVTTADTTRGAEIRMNQPLRQDGWTIYQSSVETFEGAPAPVFKLTHNPWALFPYLVSLLLLASFLVHGLVGRRRSRHG